MVEYNKLSVELSNSQLNKLKAAVKNKTGVTLNEYIGIRMNIKIFDGDELSQKLLFTTR